MADDLNRIKPSFDLTDTIAGAQGDRYEGYVLDFFHVPTKESVQFKAFLETYSDNFSSAWNQEEPFGRMDDIQTFKKTGRVITLAWSVPSFSEEEAIKNLDKAETLLSMLYPVYEEIPLGTIGEKADSNSDGVGLTTSINTRRRDVAVMVAPPLFKLKFANLIMDTSGLANQEVRQSEKNSGKPTTTAKTPRSIFGSAADVGLTGRISGFQYNPDIEEGFYGWRQNNTRIPNGYLVPQTIRIQCDFTVIHTQGLGYRITQKSNGIAVRQAGFPHAGGLLRSTRKQKPE